MVASLPGLADTPILVTGGAGGIGEAIVARFAAAGARLAFLDRDVAAGAALAERLTGAAHAPLFLPCDLTDIGALKAAAARAAEAVGPIRVLVNNAANDDRHALEEVTPDYWRNRLAVNLDHHVFAAQAVVPGMRDAGGGAIIGLGSCSWHLGLGGMPAYLAAKAAIEGLTRGLARDLGPHGIRVTCVVPGAVRTPRQAALWLTPAAERAILDGQCLKEPIPPDAVAAMVAFLASDDARFCTGQMYPVDAGWV
jgi:NAD(P)-dependent dehydrogenase (short-subunit alcohol dehydrogenase family)